MTIKPVFRSAIVLCAIVSAAAGASEPIVVTGRIPDTGADASLSEIDRDAIARLRPVHPSELRLGAPGVWISRGSGQEHLMALRSPVLTGAGACGAFAYLEYDVPVRPVGLCNVNQLFEINLWQADRLRIERGPTPLHPAAGGLHGLINAVGGTNAGQTFDILAGPDDFFQVAIDAGAQDQRDRALRLRARLAHDGGFRAQSGYDQGHINLDASLPTRAGPVRAHIAVAALQQETAGFIRGFEAFRVPAVARSNPNPEAFRDAFALRAGAHWSNGRWTVRPFLRRSQMRFLQHFLPGQPLEDNAQSSGGLMLEHRFGDDTLSFETRALIELSDMSLREEQAAPITTGSAFLQATRPAGAHYDFQVDGVATTLTGALNARLTERQRITAGLRLDGVRYRYTTALAPGNNDAQGQPCGFGGCLFTRPADRRDTFSEWAPSLRWENTLSATTSLSAALERGVRVPQITELYRLQSGQAVADLAPEVIDSLAVGISRSTARARLQATAFASVKRNGIFRDADGFNVNRGKTLHAGLEVDGTVALHPRATLSMSLTLAAHRYRFDRLTEGAEPIRRNDDVDTAPRTLGTVGLTLTPPGGVTLHMEWEHMGGYWLDAANAHRYAGHDLVHVNLERAFGGWRLGLKVRNAMDRAFAERADFAFGQYRYFPGQPRSVFVSLARDL